MDAQLMAGSQRQHTGTLLNAVPLTVLPDNKVDVRGAVNRFMESRACHNEERGAHSEHQERYRDQERATNESASARHGGRAQFIGYIAGRRKPILWFLGQTSEAYSLQGGRNLGSYLPRWFW